MKHKISEDRIEEGSGIVLEQVTSGYTGKKVLEDLSLTLPKNRLIVILGENGSGKSTLLRTMAGLLRYEGRITVDGEDMKTLDSRARAGKISLLSQMNRAYFSYTVEETVRMGRYRFCRNAFGGYSETDRLAVEDCMKRTDILGIRKERIGELSGGQQQRVYLAQMFAQEADYIFLDEPTNHLDLKYRVALEQDLKQKGQSVVAVYHDLRTAFSLADLLVLMKEGRILAAGTPEELRDSEELREAFDMDVRAYL